jgi:hypothetical protein
MCPRRGPAPAGGDGSRAEELRPYALAPYGKNFAPLRLFSVHAAKLAAGDGSSATTPTGRRSGFQQACRMGLEGVVSAGRALSVGAVA